VKNCYFSPKRLGGMEESAPAIESLIHHSGGGALSGGGSAQAPPPRRPAGGALSRASRQLTHSLINLVVRRRFSFSFRSIHQLHVSSPSRGPAAKDASARGRHAVRGPSTGSLARLLAGDRLAAHCCRRTLLTRRPSARRHPRRRGGRGCSIGPTSHCAARKGQAPAQRQQHQQHNNNNNNKLHDSCPFGNGLFDNNDDKHRRFAAAAAATAAGLAPERAPSTPSLASGTAPAGGPPRIKPIINCRSSWQARYQKRLKVGADLQPLDRVRPSGRARAPPQL
jgi:hypothetical protein